MARTFDYSKWDKIELSDDESDLHPNIDKDSWFRLKHRTRLEREEREDLEVKELEEKNKQDQARINIIQARLKAASSVSADDEDNDAQYEDLDALQIELNELQAQITQRTTRINEIRENRKWNIDNICKVKDEKTVVNEIKSKSLKSEEPMVDEDGNILTPITGPIPTASAPLVHSNNPKPVPQSSSAAVAAPAPAAKGAEPAATIKRERMAVISYNDYAIKHEKVLETFSEINDLEATKEYLFKHCDILMHEHAQSYMLLSCLEDEMNGKHKRMKLVGRQSQILSHIHELGTSMHRDPRDVILPFFRRIQEGDYLQGFLSAVDDFIKKIQKRAVEKRKEMDAERAEQEEYYDESNVPLGPGGLNPLEVLRNLPESLRDAFESQDMERLQKVLARMDPVEAKYWMRQCVDSGLWVSKDPSIFDDAPVAAPPSTASTATAAEEDGDDDVVPAASEDA